MLSRQKIIILFTVLLEGLGDGIVLPLLPFYVQRFSSLPIVLTSLFAVYSLFCFLSAPLLGVLSDKYGRRPILIISIFSTAVGWLIFAWGKYLFLLFLGRIIDGMAAGNYSTAQSYVVDITKDNKERTHNLNLTNAAFGIGLILGPALAALLSLVSPSFPFWVVGFLALFNGFLVLLLVPETNGKTKIKVTYQHPLAYFQKIFRNQKLKFYFIIWILFCLAVNTALPVLSLYLKEVFTFNAWQAGILMAGVGLFVIINQAAFLKSFWLRYFSEMDLQFWLFLGLSAGLFLVSRAHFFWFLIGLTMAVFCFTALRAIITSVMAGRADHQKKGELLGSLTSLNALASTVGALCAGALFQIKTYLPFYLAGILVLFAFSLLLKTESEQTSASC